MLTILPDVLDRPALSEVRDLINSAEFRDGRATAGSRAKRVKHNTQMRINRDVGRQIDDIVIDALKGTPLFRRRVQPKRILRPLISRYEAGMNYGFHVDDALMNRPNTLRTDVATTLFLSEPTDYVGGELEIESPFGPQYVKLPAGSAVAYPATTLHRVAPVCEGVRLAAVTWIQSHVRDAACREILSDLDEVAQAMAILAPDRKETDLAFKSYANLTRMWAET